MPRRIVRKKKKSENGIIITLDEILEKNKEVKNVSIKYGDRHKYSENTVFYLKDNFTEDNIYLITQFFIHRQEKRRKEINYCLNQNCKIFKKIILLNERIYSKEELGVDDEGWEKIVQIDIGTRLSYKKFLDYINESKLEGYFILSNTDIFFEETVLNLRKSFMSVEKSIFAISRFQYKSDGSTTQEFLIPDSQDVWIIHSNHLVCDTKKYDYNLGVPGCDNKIAMMFHKDNYKIYNCPFFIKIYHYHEDEERDYTSKDVIPGPYYYPYPVTVHRKVNELIIENDKLTKILKSNQIFWQYPVITEKRYNELNKSNENYLGIPWATMIDFNLNFGVFEEIEVKSYTTCCQHIHFRKVIPMMKKLGVNVLYTPHKIIGEDNIDGIEIRSCPLYAVNFEDPERNSDFQGKDFLEVERKYLYSFRGGSNTYYMSDIRKRIFQMEKKSDILIENSEGWHFEKTVYGGEQNKNGTYQKREDVGSYNQILLNSRYSLCPSGSGPNSIRFWESLACGSIPVLLSDKLDLPLGVNWDEAIVRVKEENIGNLDLILRNISLEEERKRREKCIEFYKKFSSFIIEEKEENMIPGVLFTSFKIELNPAIKNQLNKWKEKNPLFEIKYFSDKDVDNFFKDFEIKEASGSYFMLKNGVAKADFFRICYIYKFGGYWFDLDLDPTKIIKKKNLSFYDTGYHNVSYMLIGGVPENSLFKKLIKRISQNIKNNIKCHGKNIMNITGPKVLQKLLGEIFKDIRFEDGFFKGTEGKIYSMDEYEFHYSFVNLNTKSKFYKKLQKDNKILPFYKYNYI